MLTISGQLRMPANGGEPEQMPAVVIMHGSSGVDSRGAHRTLPGLLGIQRGYSGNRLRRPDWSPCTDPDWRQGRLR